MACCKIWSTEKKRESEHSASSVHKDECRKLKHVLCACGAHALKVFVLLLFWGCNKPQVGVSFKMKLFNILCNYCSPKAIISRKQEMKCLQAVSHWQCNDVWHAASFSFINTSITTILHLKTYEVCNFFSLLMNVLIIYLINH